MLPIAGPPLRDAWVTVAEGRVVALGTGRPPDGAGVERRDLGHSVLLPGLINAHTHLELSWLWGKVPPAASLPAWVSDLMGQRFAGGSGDDVRPIRQAVIDALEAGTAAVGDVANTAATQQALAASRLHGVVFREVVGFNPANPGALVDAAAADVEAHRSPRVRAHVVPHAPYSVAPEVIRILAARAAAPGPSAASTSGSRPTRSNSCRPAAAAGARCWRRGRPGTRAGRRPAAARSSTSIGSASWVPGCSPSTACSAPTRSWPASRAPVRQS